MSRRYDDNPLMNHNHRKQGPSWKKIMGISLCIILAIVVAGGVLIYTIGHELISSTNFVADEDVKTVQVEELPEEAKETVSAEEKKGRVLDESELNEIHQQMNQLSDVDTVEDEDVYNLLLVGVDRRDKTWNGNSDSMMLVSINHTAKRVSVVSLMRGYLRGYSRIRL